MAACIAHDLRTPLTTIGTCLEMLKKEPGETLEEIDAQLLGLIGKETKRLNEVIHELLFCSRDCCVEPARVSLTRLLSAIVDACRHKPLFKNIEISLNLPKHSFTLGHNLQLERLLENLLSNAAQALEGKGQIRIELRSNITPKYHQISFKDNGPGVPEELRDQIFSPFVSGRQQGCGLGLAICSKIVIAHGGELRLNPDLKSGCEFLIDLPVCESDPA